MIADDVALFVQEGLGSMWTLNLMLALRESPERRWSAAELVAHLRASDKIVREQMPRLRDLGLVADIEDGRWMWRRPIPSSTICAAAWPRNMPCGRWGSSI